MQYFVRSGGLVGFPERVREYGENPSDMLRAVGLSTAVLHNTDLYVPYPALADLFTLAARRCKAADFGVQLGRRQGLDVVGALGSLMCMQASLSEALRMMQRNLDFHARGVRVDVDAGEQSIAMRMSFAFADQTDCSQLTALSMALLCRSVAQLHHATLPPTEVQLALDSGGCEDAYEAGFGCPVIFNAAENQIIYPARLLSLAVDPQPALRQRLSQQWRGNWQHSEPLGLPQQVERAITALLPTGECKLEMVARVMDMHPRSLQMKLRDARSSFARLLQTVRLRLACQYLRNSDIDLTTLALNLGFAELAVFSRAFKKWTGKSPRQWRQQATGG